MRKFVNLRAPVIIALSLCGGIAVGVILYFYNLSSAWIALALLPAAVTFGLWAIFKRNLVKPAIFIFLALFLFIGGALNSFYSLDRFDKTEVLPDKEYAVHGVVTEKGVTTNGEYIIIKNIKVDGERIGGKAYVFLSATYGELCDVGYSVDFYGTLKQFDSFEYGKLNSYAEENIKYGSSVFAGLHSTYGYSFFGKIRSAISRILFNNLHRESAAIAYAMLTGNTKLAKADSLESFRYGGVAHIFAVSGLHVGIIFAIISFILKKLRVKKYPAAAICFIVVLFYTAVCGFTLSAVRATIMCAVALIAKLIRERYDGLNALAIATIIILSFSPLSLLSVGFQLSVCAVGGICCLSKCIERALKKIKLPSELSSTVGASAGAQLGTMPILLSNFGYLSGAGLLLNIIVLPLLSAIFVIIFTATVVCTIIPVAAPFIIPYAALPLEFIISVFVGAGFEKSLISGFGAGAFTVLYFICILSLSDKINLKLVERAIAIVCSVAILSSYVLLKTYSPFNGYRIIISAYNDGGEVLIKSLNGNVLIVTDGINAARLESMLDRAYCKNIDAVIILGEDDLSAFAELDVDCSQIYICDRYPQIQPYGDFNINYVTDFTVCGVNCTLYDNQTLLADVGGVKLGICAERSTQFFSCDILVTDSVYNFADNRVEVFFNNRLGTLNVYDCGDIIFKIKDGNYRLKNAIPPNR